MDSSTSTPKSNKKIKTDISTETSVRKQIRLPFNENCQIVPFDQLSKIPKREDDDFLAGDLVWVKTKGFPWWPCIITVDPETGKYSKTVVIRDKNNKAFHVQYFGKNAYRGYTQGNIMKYEGKEKYELKLDQIKNTPTPNKSQRKMELNNYEIKHGFKKDWVLACSQADEAMNLDRAIRIEKLTFEYIVDKPKTIKKKQTDSDEEDEINQTKASKSSTSASKSQSKKRKSEIQGSMSAKLSAKKKKTSKETSKKKSSPADVYDFNEFGDEFDEIVTPKKPFELSSAKRAKGEFSIYAKQLRLDIQRDYPELNEEEVEAKLKRNWELMAEDMRNSYAPRPSLFQNNNLSFQMDSPSQSYNDKSLNETDISLPDLNSSITDRRSSAKKYTGMKRGRKPKNENSKTNAFDFEKENAVETEEMNSKEEENKTTIDNSEDEKVSSNNRRSSRKKLFNQGNETVNENNEDNKVDIQQPRRKSSRMSTGGISKEDKSTIKVKKTPVNKTTNGSTAVDKTPSRKSSRQSNKSTNSIKINDLSQLVSNQQQSSQQKQQLTNTQENVMENGLSEDSVSYSSESEKTLEQQKIEENKERHCAKCYQVDKGLIKCQGECLEYYHSDCLEQEDS